MPPTTPRGDDDPTDYEELRTHIARPRLEHPAGRQQRTAPAIEPVPSRLSVMEWLVAVGHAVVNRVRGASRSALARLHPPR